MHGSYIWVAVKQVEIAMMTLTRISKNLRTCSGLIFSDSFFLALTFLVFAEKPIRVERLYLYESVSNAYDEGLALGDKVFVRRHEIAGIEGDTAVMFKAHEHQEAAIHAALPIPEDIHLSDINHQLVAFRKRTILKCGSAVHLPILVKRIRLVIHNFLSLQVYECTSGLKLFLRS